MNDIRFKLSSRKWGRGKVEAKSTRMSFRGTTIAAESSKRWKPLKLLILHSHAAEKGVFKDLNWERESRFALLWHEFQLNCRLKDLRIQEGPHCDHFGLRKVLCASSAPKHTWRHLTEQKSPHGTPLNAYSSSMGQAAIKLCILGYVHAVSGSQNRRPKIDPYFPQRSFRNRFRRDDWGYSRKDASELAKPRRRSNASETSSPTMEHIRSYQYQLFWTHKHPTNTLSHSNSFK